MFGGDWGYSGVRYDKQIKRYEKFKSNILKTKSKLLMIELGAAVEPFHQFEMKVK